MKGNLHSRLNTFISQRSIGTHVRSSVPLPSCFEQRHPTLVHLASHNLFNLEKLLFGLSVIILAFFMLGYGGCGGAPSFVAGA